MTDPFRIGDLVRTPDEDVVRVVALADGFVEVEYEDEYGGRNWWLAARLSLALCAGDEGDEGDEGYLALCGSDEEDEIDLDAHGFPINP